MELERLKYPIGKFQKPDKITEEIRNKWINSIATFHAAISDLVVGLSEEQKKWTYRPDGWNIAQLVHHCADSHLNSVVRFKWALTEDEPTIKPYFEDRWIGLGDAIDSDYTDSLALIKAIHAKWVVLLKSLNQGQLERTYIHPESTTPRTVDQTIGIYAWHCEHHLAHIRQAINAAGTYNG